MEASENHHCNSTEENERVVAVQTEPSASSNFDSNKEPKAEADCHSLEKSSDVLDKGLSSLLTTIIRDFDYRAEETLKSQDQLSSAIDRLTRGHFMSFYFK